MRLLASHLLLFAFYSSVVAQAGVEQPAREQLRVPVHQGEIEATDAGEPSASTRVQLLHRPTRTGLVAFELTSYCFEAGFCVRTVSGDIVAEAGSGPLRYRKSVTVQVAADADYIIEVSAAAGGSGPFAIETVEGGATDLAEGQLRGIELQDARNSVEARASRWGDEDPRTLDALDGLGFQLWRRGRYAEALPIMQRALRAAERMFEAPHEAIAYQTEQLAAQLLGLGRFKEAREQYERAVAMRASLHGEMSTTLIAPLGGLAVCLEGQGDLTAAVEAHRRALSIAGPGGDAPLIARTQNNLANTLLKLDRVDEAEALLRSALDLLGDDTGEHKQLLGSICNNLGTILVSGRGWSDGIKLLERALEIREQFWGGDHPDLANTLNNLGLAKLRLAERHIDRVFFGKNNLIDNEATNYLKRAIEMRERLYGPDCLANATTWANLASQHGDHQDFDAALGAQRRAVRIAESHFPVGHPQLTHFRRMLAELLWAKGDHAGAREDLRGSIAGADVRRAAAEPETLVAVESLMAMDLAVNDFDGALAGARLAFDARSHLVAASMLEQSSGDRSELALALSNSVEVLVEVARQRGGALCAEAYRALTTWKGLLFRAERAARAARSSDEQQRARLADLRSELSRLSSSSEAIDRDDLHRRLRLLQLEIREAERRMVESVGPWALAAVAPSDVGGALPPGSVFIDFQVHHPGPSALPDAPAREAVVLAWVIRRDPLAVEIVSLGSASELSTTIRDTWLPAVRGRGERVGSGGRHEALGKGYQRLWGPLAEHVRGAEAVFLCPDGDLGSVSFGSLLQPNGRYLVQDFLFVHVEDATQFCQLARTAEPKLGHSLLLLGQVDYGPVVQVADPQGMRPAEAMRTWIPLPGTGAEIDGIAQVWRQTSSGDEILRLVGDSATEGRLTSALSGYDVVHLATHGFYASAGIPSLQPAMREGWKEKLNEAYGFSEAHDGHSPALRAGLVCANANLGGDADGHDGFLTAEELADLELDSCSLVVLSACNTSVGVQRPGEGASSLLRAFRSAGARTVIASLWQVPDEGTRVFMVEFYRNLLTRRLSAARALRETQLSFIANPGANKGTDVSAWGAFVVAGDWR